jgi:hypothetical protein
MKPKAHIEVAYDPDCRQVPARAAASRPRHQDPVNARRSTAPARPGNDAKMTTAKEVQATRTVPAAQTRPPVPRDLAFRRNPALEIHRLDCGLLLTDPASGRSRRLDALAAFVWYLLKDPTTVSEAVTALRRIRPDLDPARVRCDTERLFHELHTGQMIVPEDPPTV